MIKASSLYYSVVISLLIGCFCTAFIITKHSYSFINLKQILKQKLLDDCLFEFNKQLNNINIKQKNSTITKWGLFEILKTEKISHQDTVMKIGFIGIQLKNKPALSIIKNNGVLKFEGKSYINGNIYNNGYGYQRGFHFNSPKNNSKFVTGLTLKKIENPPTLYKDFFLPQNINLKDFDTKKLNNRFSNKTKIVNVSNNPVLDNLNYSGNIVIESDQSIIVKSNCSFKNIIIKAKEVLFEENCNLNCQVYAENIYVNKNCLFQYPSVLYSVNGNINISKSTFKGIIICNLNLNIDASKIIGHVFSKKTQLNGTIYGSLDTNKIYIETKSSKLNSYILDGIVDLYKLPSNFLCPNITNQKNPTYELIKNI